MRRVEDDASMKRFTAPTVIRFHVQKSDGSYAAAFLHAEKELDLALLSLGAAFDAVGMQARKIAGKTVNKTLLFDHFLLRTRAR
jgi:hypothetical protein